MKHNISTLPKWAQKHIADLEAKVRSKDIERQRIEAMIPWTEEGMDWFTLGGTKHDPYKLFVLSRDAAHPVCSLGADDRVFIGRAKNTKICAMARTPKEVPHI